MATIVYAKCDACGKKEESIGLPKGWLKVSVGISADSGLVDTKSAEVCSFECGRKFYQQVEEAQKKIR